MPTSPLPPDPYKILGVAKDATIATIRSAYRKLVLQSHPDKFLDEAVKAQKAEEFHRVQQAYEILSDEKTRENYDARVRLAELKAERFREEANSPKRQDPPYSPRPSAERVWTTQPIFEEIRPRARHYEEHPPPPPPPSSRPEPLYEERRYRAKDYDDYDDFSPLHGITKKAGSRLSEARADDTPNRARNRWRAAAAKATAERIKEKEHDERRRVRDKGRRDDGQSKRQHNRSSLDGETASDPDSEVEAFMNTSYGSHKKESSRSYDDERHHSSRRKHESRANSPGPDRETKANYTLHSAAEYIAKSLGGGKSGRSSLTRGQSVNQIPQAPPPPSAPVPAAVEDVVRSSASRRGATSKASKSSSKIEIVEPPRKGDYERPELKASITSPTSLKPPRSATMDIRGSEPARTTIRRATTSPLTPSASASHSQKSSKLRDTHDSGYSSPGTPDNQNSRSKTTTQTYRVRVESDSESDAHTPRVVMIDPEYRRPQPVREHSMSHRSERATASSGSTRHGTIRSHTDEPSHRRHAPPLTRGATDRPLYGEVPRSSPEPRVQYSSVHESPRYGKDDVHYTPYQRRSPPSDHDPRQAYAQGRRASIPIRAGRA